MYRLYLLLFVFLLSSCCFFSSSLEPDNIPESNDQGEIQIIFFPEPEMFPDNWYGGETNGLAEPLDSSEYERSERILQLALSKYPDGLPEKYLRKIYVLGYLEFFGAEYGGTYSDGIIYLSNRGDGMGYTDLYLEQSFHHEFSSILYYAHPEFFSHKAWIKYNKGFSYGSGGVNAIQTGTASIGLSTDYAKMGVLSQYGTSSTEEDFNTFAEQLFCPSPEFWDITDSYPQIKYKVKLIISFYQRIDPVFTKQYFRSFFEK